MMNEEQLEAVTARMNAKTRQWNRENGWVAGKRIESRRQRINRVRRWRKVDDVFPDRMLPVEWNSSERTRPELALHKQFDGFEVMLTKFDRKVPPGIDAPEWVWKDLDSWKSITQYNGYCRFMSKPVIEEGYNGLLTYVPVHGGITYASHLNGVSTYGFDTAHADDDENPLVRNVEWLEWQACFMARAIRIAAMFEERYLQSDSPYRRAEIVDAYHAKVRKLTQQPFQLTNNFGAMINVICGQV